MTRSSAAVIRGFHHVQLAMPPGQEAAARAFYGDLLGMPETPKPPDLAARGGCWFETGAIRLHLGVDPDFKPARKAHPAMCVVELEALQRRLLEAGWPLRSDEPLAGRARCYVDDPFGNRIELIDFQKLVRTRPSPSRRSAFCAAAAGRR